MNLNDKPIREKYKEFHGKNTEQMELLLKDKRVPMTMKQIIEKRLEDKNNDWNSNYFDTCDTIVYNKDKFKIVLNSKQLKNLNKDSIIVYGGLLVDYKKIRGKEFDTKNLILNQQLTKEEALKHPVWKYLLGNQLKDYVKLVFSNHKKAMVIYINNEFNILRAWFVDGLVNRSGAVGRYYLDNGNGRFVGIASEMFEVKK